MKAKFMRSTHSVRAKVEDAVGTVRISLYLADKNNSQRRHAGNVTRACSVQGASVNEVADAIEMALFGNVAQIPIAQLGGRARAQSLSPRRRTAIAKMGARARWRTK